MFKGIFLVALVAAIAVFFHRRGRLEEKVFKRVPLIEWLNIFFFPVLFYIGLFSIVRNIVSRPRLEVFPVSDFDIFSVMMFFFALAFVGDGIHFTGKILWRYLNKDKRDLAYKVNEMFHGRLSHYLIYINVIFLCFMLAIIEMNHPLSYAFQGMYIAGLIAAAVIMGISSSKTVFYTSQWFGGYNKPIFFLVISVTSLLIGFMKLYELDLRYYPVAIFIATLFLTIIAIYLIRLAMVVLSLNEKRRLRFLVRFLQIS